MAQSTDALEVGKRGCGKSSCGCKPEETAEEPERKMGNVKGPPCGNMEGRRRSKDEPDELHQMTENYSMKWRAKSMIENGWVLTDNDLPDSHWDDDRSDELVEEYAGDKDIITDAVAEWLDVEGGDVDHLQIVYDNLPSDCKREILNRYIEYHDLQDSFDEWWEVRYQGDIDNSQYDIARDMEYSWRD